MSKVKFKVKDAIAKWNKNNPELRKKTVGSIAKDLGISASSLSQLEDSNQFQKHMVVVLESDIKFEQMTCFDLYKKLDIPVINKLDKITVLLDCQIFDLVEVV
jgi:hypothetical protein